MNISTIRFFRSLISMLLAVCMVLGMVPAAVFAAEGDMVKYVSLGDSMSNGYGMEGYEYEYHVGDAAMTECTDLNCTQEHEVFHWSNGFLQEVPGTYPVLVAEHYGWDLTQMAMSAMRVEDLHWTLEADYTDAAAMAVAKGDWNQDAWNAAFSNGDYITWDSFTTGRFTNVYPGSTVEEVVRLYQENVAQADVISLAIGNSNFGVFLLNQITDALGMNGEVEPATWMDVENALRALDESTRAIVVQAVNTLKDVAGNSGLPEEVAEPILNATAYTMVSFLVNYRGALDAIIALNPDVEIMLIGMMNTLSDVTLEYEDISFDFGDYIQIAVEVVNGYIAGIASTMQKTGAYADATLYFMEANDVDVLSKSFPEGIKTSVTMRERFVSDIVGTSDDPGLFWSILDGIVGNIREGAEIQFITLEDIEGYEQFSSTEQVGYAGGYMEGVKCGTDMAMSIELYLAFEDALLHSCEYNSYNVEGMLGMADLQNSGVFQPVIDNYVANIGPNSDTQFDNAVAAIAAYANVSEDLIRMAYEYGEAFDGLIGNIMGGFSITRAVDSMAMLLALRDTMCHALEADASVFGLLGLYSRTILGNSMASHPSKAGHAKLYDSFVSSYGSYTAEDHTMLIIDQLMDLLVEYGPVAIKEFYKYADEEGYTSAAYALDDDSLYVAIGDGSAVSQSYVDYVARDLPVSFRNLSAKGSIEDAYDILASNKELIAQADLITVGYGNNTFSQEAVNRLGACLSGGDPGEYDWTVYVGEEGVSYVENALAEIEAMLSEQGMGDPNPMFGGYSMAKIMTLAVEAYAYAAVAYACNLPEVVNAIRDINEEAVVVVVGMNNPFRGTILTMDDVSLNLGDYVEYLVKGANMHGVVYAVRTGNCIYVAAPEAETDTCNLNQAVIGFVMNYMNERNYSGNPTQEGHAYIAQQILNALTIVCEHEWGEWVCEKEATCTEEGSMVRVCIKCGEEERKATPYSHDFKDGVCEDCGATQSDLYRLKGSNRYLTGIAIADEVKEVLGVEQFQTVIVAFGEKFPDALTGSYLASKFDAPILLTDKSVDADVISYISSNVTSGGKVYILGGTAAVTQSFEDSVRAKGYDVERLKGKNRYETNLEILKEAGVDSNTEILIATGSNYADSLSASATGLPMLLVDKELTAEQVEFLEGTSKRFAILGGTAAVSEDIENALKEMGEVTRVKGKNRYETSVVIAQRYFNAPAAAVLAYGEAFPDGLCGGPLAVAVGAPLILANNNALAAADGYVEGISYGYVTGGTGRLTDDTVRKIFDADPACVIVVK